MGEQIRAKQKRMVDKDKLTVVIKPLATASYQQVMSALDEMQINDVKKYALMDASESEASFLRKK
jgi:biopolymer transport protein ExbD